MGQFNNNHNYFINEELVMNVIEMINDNNFIVIEPNKEEDDDNESKMNRIETK